MRIPCHAGSRFALLRNLFGELQMNSLADYIQASLMLNYNKREVG